jgi:putative transposase
MRRFRKLSETIWQRQYRIVWTARYRVVKGGAAEEVDSCIVTFSEQLHCEVLEGSVEANHVRLVVMIPLETAVSDYVGTGKGRAAIRVLNKFCRMKEKPYWGNRFWLGRCCSGTVGLGSEMIRKYGKYQEAKEPKEEETQHKLFWVEKGLLNLESALGARQFIPFRGLPMPIPLGSDFYSRR